MGDFLGTILSDVDLANKRREEESKLKNKNANFPNYATGARAKIKVCGKTIGAALEVSYSVSASMTEIRTIDQFLPWEIVPGQMSIKANLRRIVSPNRSLGGDGLYSTIQSYLHQPYATIEIRDALGNLQFYAKGMFTDLQANIQAGQITAEGVSFVGYYWRENTKQDFNPEPRSYGDRLLDNVKQNSIIKSVSSIW